MRTSMHDFVENEKRKKYKPMKSIQRFKRSNATSLDL